MERYIEYIAIMYYAELGAVSVAAIGLIVWLIRTISKMIGNHVAGKQIKLQIVGTILIAIMLVIVVKTEINYLKDFQYMIKKEFLYITGTVDKASGVGDMGGREVVFVDIETGERVTLSVPSDRVEIGEIYEVVYLSNTKIGCYVRKIEE